MKLLNFNYVCKQCQHQFTAPEIDPTAYGEFLLRSPSGEEVYLNAIEDDVYQEVDELLKELCGGGIGSVKRADLQRKVFGLSCDPDSKGFTYSMIQKPICPSCGSSQMSYWEATDPPEYIVRELKVATHIRWNRLSKEEKRECLERGIKGSDSLN